MISQKRMYQQQLKVQLDKIAEMANEIESLRSNCKALDAKIADFRRMQLKFMDARSYLVELKNTLVSLERPMLDINKVAGLAIQNLTAMVTKAVAESFKE